MAKLYNLARMTTATAGTGTITLGAAVSGYLTFAQAGVLNGDIIDYAIKDGNNSEHGRGTYTSSGATITRSVVNSTNNNAVISLSGTAEVFISPLAATLQRPASVTVFTSSGTFTTPADSTSDTVYRYRMIGGGGGGGGSTGSAVGSGAGSGAYAEGTFTGIVPSTGISMTVGSGGGGGGAGATGSAGGSSAIGSPVNITCGGGAPGVGSSSGTVNGGAGGIVTGAPNIISQSGQSGMSSLQTVTGAGTIIAGGKGAASPFGDGGIYGAAGVGVTGGAATAYGAGGGGGAGSGSSGGAGKQGFTIIERVSG